MPWIKALVIGMAALIVIGFVVIATTLVNRVASPDEERADVAFAQVEGPGSESEGQRGEPMIERIELASGEAFVSASLDGDLILLRLSTPAGVRLEIRSIDSGAPLATFDIVDAAK